MNDESDNSLDYIAAVEREDYPANRKVPLPEKFKDDRGVIDNLLFLQNGVKSIAIINSVKGSVRSNHYHLTDWHFLYVISGKMKYSERDRDPNSPHKHLIIHAGEMVFTPPLKVHKVEFLEDTVLLSCAKNVRSYQEHEKDMVPEKF